MMSAPKITFIGAGSTIFVKNILGDVFHREALKTAHIALMDIDPPAWKSRILWCVS
ncbi:family 4 glycosyl hydrolase [Shigella flexneri]